MARFLYRDLVAGRGRVALGVAAISSVVVLITVFEGFKSGLSAQVRSYADSLDVPLVVMQAGAGSTAAARSAVPVEVVEKLRAAPDVQQVFPVLIVRSIFDHAEHKTPVSVVGYREFGGPARVVGGRSVAAPDEAVFDRGLMRKHGLALGNQVMRLEAAVPGTNAMTTADFIASDRLMARQMGTDIIQVMTLIGFVIGVGVVGLTMYGATVSHAREYGVVKALGATNFRLIGLVLLQAAVMIALGFGLAIGLALVLKQALPVVAPDLAVAYPGALIGRVAVAAGAMAAISSVLPAWRIARLEPVIVFKE